MPFTEDQSWANRSPKHPQFRIGDYVYLGKDARQLAFVSGMNAPSVTGSPWQLDIETLAGERMRVPDSDLKHFTHQDASLADVIRLGFFSLVPEPSARQKLDKLLDEDAVQFFVNLCSDVGRFLALRPDQVELNIPKLRRPYSREKDVLAVSRFLAEYGLNYFDCFRAAQEQGKAEAKVTPESPTTSDFPIFGAVYPSFGGSKVRVIQLRFADGVPIAKTPSTLLKWIEVSFVDVHTGCFYKQDAQTFFDKCVRNQPDVMKLKDETPIQVGPVALKERTLNPPVKIPNWLKIKHTYLGSNNRSKYYVLNIEGPDDELDTNRVIYQFISATGSLGTVHSCPVKKFCETVQPEPIENAQEYRVLPIDVQPFDFPEDVIAGNIYKASCENEPVVVEKVFFELETSRWFALCRYLSESVPERMRLISIKALLQVGGNGNRHWTRVAKNTIEYFKNNRSVPNE